MARHSFIQMSKLSNVKGRISYIISPARQENLYTTYRTAPTKFWSSLAKENQQEFKRSGAEGTCIEAREFIIALPEDYTRYDPQAVLEQFTDEFKELKQQLTDTTGIFKIKERKALTVQVVQAEKEIRRRLDALPTLLKEDGYPDVQAFMRTYRKAEAAVEQYNRDLAAWESRMWDAGRIGHPARPKTVNERAPELKSVREELRRLRSEGQERRRQQPVRERDR